MTDSDLCSAFTDLGSTLYNQLSEWLEMLNVCTGAEPELQSLISSMFRL